MKIYIVDIIGIHSGAFYYNKAFRDILLRQFQDVEIVSNYKDDDGTGRKLFLNYYSGNPFVKAGKLLISFFRFFFFVMTNRNSCFVFLTYGNAYEIIFLMPMLLARKRIVDVHEVVSLIRNERSNSLIQRIYAKLTYGRIADAVIIHSKRTLDLLNESGYKFTILEIPHFSYLSKDMAIEGEIAEEVKSLVSVSGLNILVFGHMRISKGIDITASIITEAKKFDTEKKLNFIIAGSDPDNLLIPFLKASGVDDKYPVSILLRFISDQELRFLFTSTDFVFLPYREISQSGVMEMAIRFRKPVITSDIEYFREMLDMFPSFGYLVRGDDPEEYINLFKTIIALQDGIREGLYYTDSDLAKFDMYKDPGDFLNRLSTLLSENER